MLLERLDNSPLLFLEELKPSVKKGDLKLECDELWQVNFKLCAIPISDFWKIFAV